jgi:hypothetical protein
VTAAAPKKLSHAERIMVCAAALSPAVKERLAEAHYSAIVERRDGHEDRLVDEAEPTDVEFTSWVNLYPEAPTGQRSRGPVEHQELRDGRWLIRVTIPESLDIVTGIGKTFDEAVGMLERRTERYLEDLEAEGGQS